MNLDNFNRLSSLTGDSMLHASLHKDVIAIAIITGVVVERNSSNATHHNPVLIAMFMTLQAQAMTRIYQESFHFCMNLVVQNEEAAPGSVSSIFVAHVHLTPSIARHRSYHLEET